MKNLYVFPNMIRRLNPDERVELNITGSVLTFGYFDGTKEQQVNIDTDVLRDGSSTMVFNNLLLGNLYTLYNYREILQVLNLAASEAPTVLQQRGFMQIDKCGGEVFIKVFLLKGENELPSKTHDFSSCAHCTRDFIHPLDWHYSWTLKEVSAKLAGAKLVMMMELEQSDFWKRDVYASHGGQAVKLLPGRNAVEFVYVPGENVYLGEACCRCKGRELEVEKLLAEHSTFSAGRAD